MTAGAQSARLHGPGLTDVRMMTVAHTSFRRELKLSAPAVRAVEAGETRRAEQIADHVDRWLGFVHHHHSIEDELLWERLTQRVPTAEMPMVQLMEEQHATVDRLIGQCPALLSVWRSSATDTDASTLADHLARLADALCEHLDAEEEHVLPLMAEHISREEWEEFTRRGMESIPKGMLLTGFGMMLYEGDPEVLALEIDKLPAWLRPVLPFLGRRAFRRYARRIHADPSPPRGSRTP